MSQALKTRLGAVDSLRCFAMSAVIAEHCKILPFGWVGVWLFYVISGYVVTRSIAGLDAATPGGRIAEFYGKRAARILPPYMGYIVVGVLWSVISTHGIEWRAIVSLLFFYNNVEASLGQGGVQAWPVGHLWTISVEMQFYFVFGALLIFLPRRYLAPLLGSMLIIAPIGRFLLGRWLEHQGFEHGQAAYVIYSAPLLHSDAFSAGALLALLPKAFESRVRRRILFGGVTIAAIAYLALQIQANRAEGAAGVDILRDIISGNLFGHYQEVFVYSVVVAVSSLLLLTALRGDAPLRYILEFQPLQYIGERSYGGYLYHALALVLLEPVVVALTPSLADGMISTLIRGVALFVLAYSLIVAASAASFAYFEGPMIRTMGRNLRVALTAGVPSQARN